jgi:hypothetical protein
MHGIHHLRRLKLLLEFDSQCETNILPRRQKTSRAHRPVGNTCDLTEGKLKSLKTFISDWPNRLSFSDDCVSRPSVDDMQVSCDLYAVYTTARCFTQ